MKRVLLLAALLGLGACSLLGVGAPQTPGQTVYAARASFAGALITANAYHDLPLCIAGGTVICRTPEVDAQVVKAAHVADDATSAAESAVRTPGFSDSQVTAAAASATSAVEAFLAITTTLKVR